MNANEHLGDDSANSRIDMCDNLETINPTSSKDTVYSNSVRIAPPQEVMDLVAEAAYKEHDLRINLGANAVRISVAVYKPMNIGLTRLAARGVDISTAYPPDAPEVVEFKSDENEYDSDAERIERHMSSTGVSYMEAKDRLGL